MFFFESDRGSRRPHQCPPVGTELYIVREHLYYAKDHAGPLLEYIVCLGRLRRYIVGGYVQMELLLENAGANNLAYPKLCDIGKSVFFSEREAALLAKKMTEKYEKIWAFTIRSGSIPLRRPWRSLLED